MFYDLVTMAMQDRINLTDMAINDILKELHDKGAADTFQRYAFECDNINLSILTASHYQAEENRGKYVEIGFMDKDWEWFKMYDMEKEDDGYDCDASIIHYFPLLGLPLLLAAMKHIKTEDVRDAFENFENIIHLV